MAKRDKVLELQKECKTEYDLVDDKGIFAGQIIYDPSEDTAIICLTGVTAKIPGVYLRSLYSALGDLVG
jgi:hypothetical protein